MKHFMNLLPMTPLCPRPPDLSSIPTLRIQWTSWTTSSVNLIPQSRVVTIPYFMVLCLDKPNSADSESEEDNGLCDEEEDVNEGDNDGKKRKYALKGSYIDDSAKRSTHFCKKRKRLSNILWEIGAETGAYGYLYLRPYYFVHSLRR
jgi:hypothetical protein